MKRKKRATSATPFQPWNAGPQRPHRHRARRRHQRVRLRPAPRTALGPLCLWLHQTTREGGSLGLSCPAPREFKGCTLPLIPFRSEIHPAMNER